MNTIERFIISLAFCSFAYSFFGCESAVSCRSLIMTLLILSKIVFVKISSGIRLVLIASLINSAISPFHISHRTEICKNACIALITLVTHQL